MPSFISNASSSDSVSDFMAATLQNAVQSKEVRTLDTVRLRPAKAQHQSPTESTRSPLLDRLAGVKKAALVAVHGSGKAAAIEIGCDQSQMNRQLTTGTFDMRQDATAGEAYLAKLGELLIEEFGAARKSKKQLAREALPLFVQQIAEALEE
jgi:hypothetical protein